MCFADMRRSKWKTIATVGAVAVGSVAAVAVKIWLAAAALRWLFGESHAFY